LNFPHDHPLYLGNHWSGPPHQVLSEADVILVIDCDVPWIKTQFKPQNKARVFHIDIDPLKVQMSLFHIDTDLSCQANSETALMQLHDYVSRDLIFNGHESTIRSRTQDLEERHQEYTTQCTSLEITPDQGHPLTSHYILSRLRKHIDNNTIIMNEGISNYRPVVDVLRLSQPGSYFTSGATALGWHGGAAVGAKLAQPTKTVIAITGDGSFLFSIPSSVHWMARRYEAPFLTIILNNRGWKSPMLSTMAVHKDGYSSKAQSDDLHVTFDPPCDYAQIAVASGARYGSTVKSASELDGALELALKTVRGGGAAVLDVWLPKFNVGDPVG
jgi:acetolactate synthase-1/2/3 large subunit